MFTYFHHECPEIPWQGASEHLPNHYFTHQADCFMLFGLVHIKGLLHRCLCSFGVYWLLVVGFITNSLFLRDYSPLLSLSLWRVSKYSTDLFYFRHSLSKANHPREWKGNSFHWLIIVVMAFTKQTLKKQPTYKNGRNVIKLEGA